MNTGNVLVGLILTDVRDQFTTIGGNVNLASRLEAVASKTRIHRVLIHENKGRT